MFKKQDTVVDVTADRTFDAIFGTFDGKISTSGIRKRFLQDEKKSAAIYLSISCGTSNQATKTTDTKSQGVHLVSIPYESGHIAYNIVRGDVHMEEVNLGWVKNLTVTLTWADGTPCIPQDSKVHFFSRLLLNGRKGFYFAEKKGNCISILTSDMFVTFADILLTNVWCYITLWC